MVGEFGNECCKLEANGHWVGASVQDFYFSPSLVFGVFYVEFGIGWCFDDPEADAVLPTDEGALEDESLLVDFQPFLWGNVVVEEGVEEAAEEDEDGEGPVCCVCPVACKTEEDDEEHDVPSRSSVVLGVRRGAPAEERCEFFHKSLYFSIVTWWAIVDLNH